MAAWTSARRGYALGMAVRIGLVALALAVLGLGAWWAWGRTPDGGNGAAGPAVEFLNTGPDVAYVGSAACVECHADLCAHYDTTPHGRSFGEVDPAAEPPPASFWHPATSFAYDVYVDGDELRMRESIQVGRDEPELLGDHAMEYFIGSGAHTRSYGFLAGEFLYEAPVTHYASLDGWAVSPGYDAPRHYNFTRPLAQACLVCHVGRVETVEHSEHRVRIHELAIGCESCHGPGALHVERYAGTDAPTTGEPDPTIVNPKWLDRNVSMDLCGRCHRPAPLNIDLPDVDVYAWRPGLPLNDFRIRYRRADLGTEMSLEGHPDQLRASVCFQQSGTMTCTTCHDPHESPPEGGVSAYYRQKCETCHAVDACGTDPAHHAEGVDMDDCIACHMPTADTEVPHVAFNHHRVGIHDDKPPVSVVAQEFELVPADDDSHLSEQVRERNLALAYFKFSLSARHPDERQKAIAQATQILEKLYEEGYRDPDATAVSAALTMQSDPELSFRLAEEALAADPLPMISFRITAYESVLRHLFTAGRLDEALERLDELHLIRRNAMDWMLRSTIRKRQNRREEARAAMETALEIQAANPEVQSMAAETFAWLGDEERAAKHRALADAIRRRAGVDPAR